MMIHTDLPKGTRLPAILNSGLPDWRGDNFMWEGRGRVEIVPDDRLDGGGLFVLELVDPGGGYINLPPDEVGTYGEAWVGGLWKLVDEWE